MCIKSISISLMLIAYVNGSAQVVVKLNPFLYVAPNVSIEVGVDSNSSIQLRSLVVIDGQTVAFHGACLSYRYYIPDVHVDTLSDHNWFIQPGIGYVSERPSTVWQHDPYLECLIGHHFVFQRIRFDMGVGVLYSPIVEWKYRALPSVMFTVGYEVKRKRT